MKRFCAAIAAFGLSGCIVWNDPCQGLVENPEEEIAWLSGDVYLDRPNTRHANHPIGQMAAEAFIDAFAETDRPAAFGLLNGGAIRSEGGVVGADGQCVTRTVLKAGPLTNGELHQILFFDNTVYAVDLTEAELFEVMEHSASGLNPKGTPIAVPSGRFLHIAGGTVTLDCSRPIGTRVTELKVGGAALNRTGRERVRVAMSAYLLGGGDGYAMLTPLATDGERDPVQAQKERGIDNDLVAAWMKRTYNGREKAFPVRAEDRTDCTTADLPCSSPIRLVNCEAPLPPQ